jgi:hypothetical protein
MKVTGVKLREALKTHELRRDVLAEEFQKSLTKFPAEEKRKPPDVMYDYETAEMAIAVLQQAQIRYNEQSTVKFAGGDISLSYAIKLLGGLNRVEALWRKTVVKPKDRYGGGYEDVQRNKDTEYAVPVMDVPARTERAVKAAARANALRAAVGYANNQEIEVEIDPELLK